MVQASEFAQTQRYSALRRLHYRESQGRNNSFLDGISRQGHMIRSGKCSVHTRTGADPTFMQCASFFGLEDSAHRRPLHADRLQDSRCTGNNRSHTTPKRHILCACCDPHSTSSNYLQNGDHTSDSTGPAAQLPQNEVFDRLHCRFGHAGRDRVRELMRNGELLIIPDSPICDACVRGKQSRESLTCSKFIAIKPGDVINSDVAGPLPRSHSGCQYTVSFIDEHSRCVTR
jgi:hypothetical protein